MAIWFNTYKPLCGKPRGEIAIEKFGLPRFIDHSIRREPDFESKYPSITSVCRKDKFIPRVAENDVVIYCTVQGRYLGIELPHWRFVAVLRVLKKLNSHELAAEWYRSRNIPLPSNCLVTGNNPRPLIESTLESSPEEKYQKRVKEYQEFLVCEKLFTDLNLPEPIYKSDLFSIFGRVPPSQNPTSIEKSEAIRLIKHISTRIPKLVRIIDDIL
jgi:hypothetical protein